MGGAAVTVLASRILSTASMEEKTEEKERTLPIPELNGRNFKARDVES